MGDITTKLLGIAIGQYSDVRTTILEAHDEIVWLRKEAKMWRLRATQAACDANVEPSIRIGN